MGALEIVFTIIIIRLISRGTSVRIRLLLLKCCFTSTETVGLLGTGAQDGHLDFHTAPELCGISLLPRLYIYTSSEFLFLSLEPVWPSGKALGW